MVVLLNSRLESNKEEEEDAGCGVWDVATKGTSRVIPHPGGNPGANLKSISHRWHPILVAFVWELTKGTIVLPLGCLKGG